MLGVEMMLSNMIGMKPEELQAAVKGVIGAIHQAATDMQHIKSSLQRIEKHLEIGEEENVGSAIVPIASSNDQPRIEL